MKPLWAVAGVALLGTAGVAGAVIVASSGGEEEVVQQAQTATATVSPIATSSPSTAPATTPVPSPTPTTETSSYTDSISSFSFEYPAPWFVAAPVADPTITGYTVTIFSYNPEKARSIGVAPPPEELKIDVNVDPNPEGLTVEQWIAQRTAGPEEGVLVISEERSEVDGKPAVKRLVSIEETKVIEYFFAHQGKMYSVIAYTAESLLIGELDAMLVSFRFPR